MNTLLTASALLIQALLLVAGFIVAERARHEATKLRLARETVHEVELAVESLRKQLASLRGKFYATKEAPPLVVQPGLPQPGDLPACDNWLAAQLEGPRSRAAACDCRYCLEQRHHRAQQKAAILAARAAPSRPVNGSE